LDFFVLKVLPGLIIFVGSYFPLFLILLAQGIGWPTVEFPCGLTWQAFPEVSITGGYLPRLLVMFTMVSLVCLLATSFLLANRRLGHSIDIKSSKPVASELMGYVLPYVVSFMGMDFSDTGRIIGFAIFLTWMFVLTFRSGQILMNPALIVFGYRLHEIEYCYVGSPDKSYTSTALNKGSGKFALGLHKAQDLENMMVIKEQENID
jgi:hypothetical protein